MFFYMLIKSSDLSWAGDRRHGFHPWVGKISWGGKWQPTPVFLPGKSNESRSLAGYSSWGHQESDTTEHTHTTTGLCNNNMGDNAKKSFTLYVKPSKHSSFVKHRSLRLTRTMFILSYLLLCTFFKSQNFLASVTVKLSIHF